MFNNAKPMGNASQRGRCLDAFELLGARRQGTEPREVTYLDAPTDAPTHQPTMFRVENKDVPLNRTSVG